MRKIVLLREKIDLVHRFGSFFRGDGSHEELSLRRCWSVWSESGRKRQTRGFRMIPGTGFVSWPYVKGRADTVSQEGVGEYLVPMFFVAHVLLATETDYLVGMQHRQWSTVKSEFAGLHELLGGSPNQLDQIEELLFHGLSLPFSSKEARTLQYKLCCSIWPSEKHVFVRNFLEAQFDSETSLEVPLNLGIWENIALMSSFCRSRAGGISDSTAKTAWRLLHQAPQHDFEQSARDTSHFILGVNVVGAKLLLHAFVALTKHGTEAELDEWSKAPLFQTVLQDMARDREGPWHLGYMEAAAGYDGLDQPELAWNMLCSGNFWVNRRGGNWRVFFDAALALANRRGWVDIVEAMEDMAERAQLD